MDGVLVIESRLIDHRDWVVRSRFFIGDGTGRAVLTSLTIEPASLYPWPPPEPLGTDVLRSISINEMQMRARAVMAAGQEIGLETVASEFHANRRPGMARRPDTFYVQLASWYLQRVKDGSPTKDLAAELQVSQSQARDLIHEARRRNLLTKGTRGQAGGELTKKALDLLLSAGPAPAPAPSRGTQARRSTTGSPGTTKRRT